MELIQVIEFSFDIIAAAEFVDFAVKKY